MIITYYGKQFVKVQFGDTVLAVNPISKDSKLKGASFGADIALVSLNNPDFNGIERVSRGTKEPFVISGPGEYEINGIPVKGILTNSQYNKEHKINTVYTVELEGINLCFTGHLHSVDISDEQRGSLGKIDILFVPISGGETLSSSDAHKLATKLETGVIIPLDYDKASIEDFTKEAGEEKIAQQEKLTIKKKDTEGRDGEIVVLRPSV